jgi:hypothetical protein
MSMLDVTMSLMTMVCVAMILAALAFTAYEFRWMSDPRNQRKLRALQVAPDTSTARVLGRRTR